MSQDDSVKCQAARDAVKEVLETHLGKDDPKFLFRDVLGDVIHEYSQRIEPKAVGSMLLEDVVSQYVARQIGPQAPDYLRLHAHLVGQGANAENPFDFEHCDRYGAPFADEEGWKSFAIQTQNLTYMVVLVKGAQFVPSGETYEQREAWQTHLRVCTAGPNSYDFSRPRFTDLAFLASREAVDPEDNGKTQANSYFRYKDGRDRGYLCSVTPSLFKGGEFETKDVLKFGPAYSYLTGITYDLACHVSCLPKEDRRPRMR